MRKFVWVLAFLVWVPCLSLMGCDAAPLARGVDGSETAAKGSAPWLSQESRIHIEARHVRGESFPEKSKFVPGFDYEAMVQRTYEGARRVVYERDRWVYDWEVGFPVGRRGETACRLVTEKNGEVVTFYPIRAEYGG